MSDAVAPQFLAVLLGCGMLAAAYEVGSGGGRVRAALALLLLALTFPAILVGSWLLGGAS